MCDYYQLNDNSMRGSLRDWRKALHTPATYRVGNTVRIQPQLVMYVTIFAGVLLILFYYNWWITAPHPVQRWSSVLKSFNSKYPLTPSTKSGSVTKYRIGLVADLDKQSRDNKNLGVYKSHFKKGFLSFDTSSDLVEVSWDTSDTEVLKSSYSYNGRGMELSELIVFDGKLLTFDDRSGLVFEIINNKIVPWVILSDGNGKTDKGFKAEWATVKDKILYVGSMGKEWTSSGGDFESNDPMWVKAVSPFGEVQHLNWEQQYKSIRKSIGIEWPGYMIHESAAWSPVTQKWYFLPRRCSREPYNETRDEVMGCNYLISADSNFLHIKAIEVGPRKPTFGFSSFKFLPGSNDEVIVAIKTREFKGETNTYITAFKTDGTILLEDKIVDNLYKYEGFEFI